MSNTTYKGINHDLRVVDGRTLVMPAWKGGQAGYGNLALPDIRDVDSKQKYPVGTKLLDNERVFYYAKASGNGVTAPSLGVENVNYQTVAQREVKTAVSAGAKEIIFTMGQYDGLTAGTIAEDELAGGFTVIFPAALSYTFECRIIGNTSGAWSNSKVITLTLQDEIPRDIVATTDHLECMANMFIGCQTGTDENKPIVGVAHASVTAGYWFWLQTWGPAWLSPAPTVLNAANDHMVVFAGNGALREMSDTPEKRQVAGFGLGQARNGGQGAPFFFLTITP